MTFLELVNDVAQRLNEVELTSTTFDSSVGVYSSIKQSVNSSIQYISQDTMQWPFYFNSVETTLVAGTARYSFPTDAMFVDFNTFRIKRDDTLGNTTRFLHLLDYEKYLQTKIDDEYNTSESIRSIPNFVSEAPNQEFVLNPNPKEAYELVYEYYAKAVDLVEDDDEPLFPDDFRHVIVDGAMYYNYLFRSDYESADRTFNKFKQGIKNMRKNYSNRYEYARDTRVNRGGNLTAYPRSFN